MFQVPVAAMDHVRMAGGDTRAGDPTTRLVVGTYVILVFIPFVIAATHESFWQRAHSMAPVATGLFAGLLIALVLGQRWAWLLLVLFEVAALVSFAFDFPDPLFVVLTLVSLALLVSQPTRRHLSQRRRLPKLPG
jgi:chromate transport protein ChrA